MTLSRRVSAAAAAVVCLAVFVMAMSVDQGRNIVVTSSLQLEASMPTVVQVDSAVGISQASLSAVRGCTTPAAEEKCQTLERATKTATDKYKEMLDLQFSTQIDLAEGIVTATTAREAYNNYLISVDPVLTGLATVLANIEEFRGKAAGNYLDLLPQESCQSDAECKDKYWNEYVPESVCRSQATCRLVCGSDHRCHMNDPLSERAPTSSAPSLTTRFAAWMMLAQAGLLKGTNLADAGITVDLMLFDVFHMVYGPAGASMGNLSEAAVSLNASATAAELALIGLHSAADHAVVGATLALQDMSNAVRAQAQFCGTVRGCQKALAAVESPLQSLIDAGAASTGVIRQKLWPELVSQTNRVFAEVPCGDLKDSDFCATYRDSFELAFFADPAKAVCAPGASFRPYCDRSSSRCQCGSDANNAKLKTYRASLRASPGEV